MKVPIILICGHAGVGKDTIASYVVEKLKTASILSLADPLKTVASTYGYSHDTLWGPSHRRQDSIDLTAAIGDVGPNNPKLESALSIDQEKALLIHQLIRRNVITDSVTVTARQFLQRTGDIIRQVETGIFTRLALEKCDSRLTSDQGFNLVVVPDGRRRDEILGFKKHGAFVVKVCDKAKARLDHPSETELDGIPDFWFDHKIINGLVTIEWLYQDIRDMFKDKLGINIQQ